VSTANILTDYETCERKGTWSLDWESIKLHPTEMLYRAQRSALMQDEREDAAEYAGEQVIGMAAERGADTKVHNVYDSMMSHACLADILTAHLRKDGEAPWRLPGTTMIGNHVWEPEAFLRGNRLTRIIMVDHWSDDRHLSEYRSWKTLGEVVAYQMPMIEIVMVLGASRGGKRHSPWTKGLLHPKNRKLRFRKKEAKSISGFTGSWIPVWREERQEISRERWLEALEEDDVLRDICFAVDIPVPSPEMQKRVKDIAERTLDKLMSSTELAESKLSVCDSPRPCQFHFCCHGKTPSVPDPDNFVYISNHHPHRP